MRISTAAAEAGKKAVHSRLQSVTHTAYLVHAAVLWKVVVEKLKTALLVEMLVEVAAAGELGDVPLGVLLKQLLDLWHGINAPRLGALVHPA